MCTSQLVYKCSWVEASLLALQRRPADATRANETDHAVDTAGAVQLEEAGKDQPARLDYRYSTFKMALTLSMDVSRMQLVLWVPHVAKSVVLFVYTTMCAFYQQGMHEYIDDVILLCHLGSNQHTLPMPWGCMHA